MGTVERLSEIPYLKLGILMLLCIELIIHNLIRILWHFTDIFCFQPFPVLALIHFRREGGG